MGAQWFKSSLGPQMSEYCLRLFTSFFSSFLRPFDRLAVAAFTKEEAEQFLGKEKQQGEILR